MQLALDAADRLVELVEEHGGSLRAEEAARALFALSRPPSGYARTLLDETVQADSRLAWSGTYVVLAGRSAVEWAIESATFIVVDVETTGLRPGTSRLCEIGAVRLRGLAPSGSFQTLVDPGQPLPRTIAALTGLSDSGLRDAPPPREAVRKFVCFAGECVLVAHNARFDLAFLNCEVERFSGRKLAAPVVDTVGLARRLLAGRVTKTSLAALANFFGTSAVPCHRALPDAQATAEVLVELIGLAQERGAVTVGDLCRLAAPRARRVYDKRSLAFGAPPRPGVYLFRDRTDRVLYVGKARDLRARLRSYFRSERQRPAVEAALAAVERIEWRVFGSELEAALNELRLIRALRPPANARATRPDRYVYFARNTKGVQVCSRPTDLGPIRSRRRAQLAARALRGASSEELGRLAQGGPLPRLHARLRELSEAMRYEDAARMRDRIAALEAVVRDLRQLEQLRCAEFLLFLPAVESGFQRLFVVSRGRIAAVRTVPIGNGRSTEIEAALTEARGMPRSSAPADADELLLVGSALRRPPPELAVIPLDGRLPFAPSQRSPKCSRPDVRSARPAAKRCVPASSVAPISPSDMNAYCVLGPARFSLGRS